MARGSAKEMSALLFRKAVPNFFTGSPAKRLDAEHDLRMALAGTRPNAGSIGPKLAAWIDTAVEGRQTKMSTGELMASLGICFGCCFERRWETDLIVAELKRQAKLAGYEL